MKFAGGQLYAWHLSVPKPPQRRAPNGTQRMTVRCARCKDCFQPLAHPMFNWVLPYRAITPLTFLLLLTALLVLGQP